MGPVILGSERDDVPRLSVYRDVDMQKSCYTGVIAGAPREDAAHTVVPVKSGFVTLDGSMGCGLLWARDARGWQLLRHGNPAFVVGNSLQVCPYGSDITSRARIFMTGDAPIDLPPVRNRIVAHVIAPGADGLTEAALYVHCRVPAVGGYVSIVVANPNVAADTLKIREAIYTYNLVNNGVDSPVVYESAKTQSFVVSGQTMTQIAIAPSTPEAVLSIVSTTATLRVRVMGGIP